MTNRSKRSSARYLLPIVYLAIYGNALAQNSALVYEDAGGSLAYGTYANHGQTNSVNTMPDFSSAGYKGGGVPIPFVPAVVTINAPTGGDDRALIQNAINTVAGMSVGTNGFRGAVLIKAGNYQVGSTLNINDGGIVIRGEGQQASGGTKITMTATVQDNLFDINGTGYSPSTGSQVPITDSFVPTGAKSFNVSSAASYAAGDNIRLHYKMNAAWLSDIGMDNIIDPDDVPPDESWTTGEFQLEYDRVVTAITGNTIYVDAPLVQPIEDQYGGADVFKLGAHAGRISNVGIESLRLESTYTNDTDEAHGWTAVWIKDVENAWVRQVTARYFGYSCVAIYARCRNVTVEDCAQLDPKSVTTGGRKYSFRIDDSWQLLNQRCYTRGGRHDFVSGSKTPGPNVFVDGLAENTFSDVGPHFRWATGELYDNIKCGQLRVQNRWDSGTGHGWSGAQVVFWNSVAPSIVCDVPTGAMNFSIGCIGSNDPGQWRPSEPDGIWESQNTHITTPRSLYYRQLRERMGRDALRNVILPLQETGTVWTELASWAGEGLFGSNVIAWTSADLIMPPTNTVTLTGRIRNLKMLDGGATSAWTKVSGPGNVSFGNAASLSTTASFSTTGVYVVRLTADDGVTTASYDLSVRYGNTAPVVDAGTNQTVTLGGGTPWTPADITTRGWYDASDTNSIVASGATVSQLNDKSGNSRHLTPSGAGNPATTGTDVINGRNTIRFDGTAMGLVRSAFPVAASGDLAVFTAAQVMGVNSSFDSLISMDAANNDFQFGANNNSQFDGVIAVAGIGSAQSLTGGPFAGPSAYGLIFDRTGGVVYNAYVDGTKRTADTAYTANLSSSQLLRLGVNRGNNNYLDCRIGEVILTDDVSLDTRETVEGYLAHKWGTAAQLPVDHPYKAAPPGGFGGAMAVLDGTASDSEGDPLTALWTLVSGPASVTFGSATAVDTSAFFTTNGVYTLRLTVSDGYAQTSNECVVTVNEAAIDAPSGLIAAAISDSQIDLTWVDNSTNETGFAVERSATSGSGFSLLGSTAANVTNYSDSTVSAGQTWYYRVVATNAAESSLPSGEASATTPNLPPVVDAGTNQTVQMSGAPWTPAQIATRAWYDASDTNSITLDTGKVSQWNDKSGNNNHAIQTNAVSRPDFQASDPMVSNLPSIGNVSENGAIGLNTPSVAAKHIYAVAYYKDGVASTFDVYSTLLSGPGSYGTYRVMGNSPTDALIGSYSFNTAGTYKNGSTNSTQVVLPMAASILKLKSTNSVSQVYSLGYNSVYTNRDWQGHYSEWIFTDGTEDAATEHKIEGYLAHKWGITNSLPEGHPYKTAAPGAPTAVVTLDATVTDPESDPFTVTWTMQSGPASVIFTNAATVDTDAIFTEMGVYTLRLTADDGFGTNYDECVITVTNAVVPTYTLTVTSDWGNPSPSGVTTNNADTPINAYMGGSPAVVGGTTQYVATGWLGTGSLGNGSGTNTAFTITNDTTITWQWQTNYWVDLNITGN